MKKIRYFCVFSAILFLPFLMGASGLGGGGCGTNDSNSTVTTLTSITVTPSEQSILINTTQQFTATGNYSDGSRADISSNVIWSSSDLSLVTINNVGLATAGASETPSPLTISATLDSVTGDTTLSVVDLTPAINSISPTTGSSSGGNSVTITGLNLNGTSAVFFASTPAASFTVNSNTQITAVSPAHAAGLTHITATTSYGTSATSSSDAFTYVDGPTVSGVSPNLGLTGGGTSVIITGAGFTGATAVDFGAIAATSFTIDSDTQITASSPAGSSGTVNITVTTPYGTSPTSSADEFTYGNLPTVTGVSPNSGPISGGASVTITGTNFASATDVNFGSSSAISFIIDSNNQITATSPAGSGTVNVTVTTHFGSSATSSADEYTYLDPPSLSVVSPPSGSASGGQGVTLFGTDLTGTTSVTFGGVAATSVYVVDSTTVTAVTPAHAIGAVNVVLTTPGGSATRTNGYTYVTTAVGQSAYGGTIACLGGGLNNLIAPTLDNNPGIIWGGSGIDVNADDEEDGATNTENIVNCLTNSSAGGCPGNVSVTSYAAGVCSSYEVDSQGHTPCESGNTCYDDWFLPAQDQLDCLYTNQVAIGGFDPTGNYWSSTNHSALPNINALFISFSDGSLNSALRSTVLSVRCTRVFSP